MVVLSAAFGQPPTRLMDVELFEWGRGTRTRRAPVGTRAQGPRAQGSVSPPAAGQQLAGKWQSHCRQNAAPAHHSAPNRNSGTRER
eukprot:642857-Prymnesium_polylepis.1